MKFREFQHEPVKPDTYEASMALNQLLKIGKHAIKIHNMIDDRAEMESWVAKKIDLAGDYVKKVHGYMQGEKAGLYDDGGMTEIKKMPKGTGTMYGVKEDAPFGSGMDLVRMAVMRKFISAEEYMAFAKELKAAGEETAEHYDDWPDGEGFGSSDGNFAIRDLMSAAGYEFDEQDRGGRFIVTKMPDKLEKMGIKNARMRDAVTTEDAGEGHMSKSQLYQTAKMSIELLDMIRKGDDLEGWVQTKLNLAADYLQAVYHYEDYQKLNPYREELDSSLMQRHAGIIQKHLDEILERKCRAEDVDTKPGMMRILAKRVNEVEKEIAKENRKKTNEGSTLEEGIKDWARNLAMAGVIVAGLAGVGSIQDAIDRSVPAVQAMETALEMAQDQGNNELADMIEKDLSAVKVRLESGKDLNFVKGMQEKYSKFVKTEGLAYESRLAIMLNQQLK